MKINTHKKRSPKKSTTAIIVAAVLILVLAAGSFVYVYAFNGNLFGWEKPSNSSQNNQNDINYDSPTEEQIESGTSIKENSLNGSTDGATSNVNISITAASQNDSTLQIRALIPVVTSDGSCTLTLTSGSRVVTKNSEVQALSNASTCKGFDVSTSELSKGPWDIEIKYTNGSQQGSALGSVEIK